MTKHRAPRKHLPHTKTEPAVTRGAVVAALTLLSGLGVTWAGDLDRDQIAALAVVGSILVPLLQGLWTRFAVTANAKVIARVTTGGGVVAGDAAVSPTGSALPTNRRGASPLPTLDPVVIQAGLVKE